MQRAATWLGANLRLLLREVPTWMGSNAPVTVVPAVSPTKNGFCGSAEGEGRLTGLTGLTEA